MKRRMVLLGSGGLGYGLALFLVIQIAFTNGFLAGLALPARTARSAAYDDFKVPQIATVDLNQIAKSVAEDTGGRTTVALPPAVVIHTAELVSAPSGPPARFTAPQQASGVVGGIPNQVMPSQVTPAGIAAFVARIPASWQLTQMTPASLEAFIAGLPSSCQSAILTQPMTATAAAFMAALPPSCQTAIQGALHSKSD